MHPEKALDEASDKAQLEAIISGLTEGVIILGFEGTIRYANTAALNMHGVAQLEELGATTEAYKANYQLSTLEGCPVPSGEQPLERLLKGESFDSVSVRVEAREKTEEDEADEWTHECRGFQVLERGEPDFAVLILKDITEQVEAKARFEQTFEANPAPAIINRLSDLRYVKVNGGFLRMTGFSEEELIGRTVYDYDVLEGAANRELATGKFEAREVIPQMESRLKTKAGSTKFVVIAGQPLDLDDEACMLFSFIDLDERKKAEDALRQSEERFSKAFHLGPSPASISSLEDYRILDINGAFEAATGYGRAEAVGRTTASLGMWVERSERAVVEAALEQGRGYRNLEVQFRTKSDAVLDTLTSAEVVTINGLRCILSIFQDITERRRSEAELVEAIETVMKDASWFSHSVVEKLANLKVKQVSGEGAAVVDLTKREREVLEYLCDGWKNSRIAQELGVADNTVRNYVANIYSKTGVHSRSDAIIWARARGIVGPKR